MGGGDRGLGVVSGERVAAAVNQAGAIERAIEKIFAAIGVMIGVILGFFRALFYRKKRDEPKKAT